MASDAGRLYNSWEAVKARSCAIPHATCGKQACAGTDMRVLLGNKQATQRVPALKGLS